MSTDATNPEKGQSSPGDLDSSLLQERNELTELGNKPVNYADIISRFNKTQVGDMGTSVTDEELVTEVGVKGSYEMYDYESNKISEIWNDKEVAKYIKPQYLESILDNLKEVVERAGVPSSGTYVDKLLLNIRELRDLIPYDPIMDLLMPFHNSLIYENKWADYSSDQYKKAHDILNSIATTPHLKHTKVLEAVRMLRKSGFDTQPFTLEKK